VFLFQGEDGIRDWSVTGVQTCALPISRDLRNAGFDVWLVEDASPALASSTSQTSNPAFRKSRAEKKQQMFVAIPLTTTVLIPHEIGRASCRERREVTGGADTL